jgi:hypothetical protein
MEGESLSSALGIFPTRETDLIVVYHHLSAYLNTSRSRRRRGYVSHAITFVRVSTRRGAIAPLNPTFTF